VKDAIEFYNLGLGEYYTFASISGRNWDLLDALIDSHLKPEPTQEEIALPLLVGKTKCWKIKFYQCFNW
jgi:GTP-binding protein